jgi:K(+)-stimulated pyrophosphate-energized sodium pump
VELAVSVSHQSENGPMITHVLAALFFLVSVFFVWRSFHKMRIGTLKSESSGL